LVSDVRTRKGTAAELAALNPTPRIQDRWVESDTGLIKVGDGATELNALPYASSGSSDSPSFIASDHGFVAWTFDPMLGASTLTLTAGTLYVARMKVAEASPITNVLVPLTTGGTGTTSSYVAVYNSSGTEIGVSADQGTSWASAGTKAVALTTPTASQAVGADLLVAILAVGGSPVIRAAANAATVNQGTSAPLARFATLASQTTPPASLSGLTNVTQPWLLFLS
jgi:hypothetical protein